MLLFSSKKKQDLKQSKFQCLAAKVQETKICSGNCTSTLWGSLLEDLTDEKNRGCTSRQEEFCLWRQKYKLRTYYHSCPRQCHEKQYKIDVTTAKVAAVDKNSIGIRLRSAWTKEYHNEYLIYDLLDLIGAVGGSLGLFIGFSFFGLIVDAINFLSRFTRK